MRTILVNSAKLVNESTENEKCITNIMYATAFCNLIRTGTLYKRENGIDGLPKLVITLGNTEYKCSEYLVEKLLNDNYTLNPYEDTTVNYLGLDELPTPEYIQLRSKMEVKELPSKSKKEKEKEKEKEETPAQEFKNEPVEITLSDEQQIEALIEQTDNYRLETVLNISLAVVCAIFAMGVFVFF